MKKISLYMLTLTLAAGGLQLASAEGEVTVNRALLPLLQPLPESVENPDNPSSDDKIDLGRMLYFDKRLSADRTVSCATCHNLEEGGDDNAAVSTGIKGQKGGRSAPSTYNAALHVAQFWDGREPDVERQAMGPPLNPIEMGMKDGAHVESVLKSVPGYVEAFEEAFPDEKNPVTFENMGKAIGAFERGLLTPAPWDDFLEGDEDALTDVQKEGLNLFLGKGCVTCHQGPGVGGHLYHKLGLVKPWPTEDKGRAEVEGFESQVGFFKVPSLRNVTETAPYLHDGSIETLEEIVKKMAEHQQGHILTDEETKKIIEFLKSLKGEIDEDYIAEPELPKDGPKTPKPKRRVAAN